MPLRGVGCVPGSANVMRPELGTSLDARGIRQKASKMLRRLVKFVEEDTSGQLGGLLAIVALGALVWLFRAFLL